MVPAASGDITLNADRRTVKLKVTSLCDRPIQVSLKMLCIFLLLALQCYEACICHLQKFLLGFDKIFMAAKRKTFANSILI